MRKTKKDAQITRQSLLDAALIVFYEKGVTKATIAEIAKQAGVTRGALYWHFKNKEDVFEQLSLQFIEADKKMLEQAIASEHVWLSFQETFRKFFAEISSSEKQQQFASLFFQLFDIRDSKSVVHKMHKRYDEMWKDYMNKGIRQAQKAGDLPADLDREWAYYQLGATVIGLMKMLIGGAMKGDISMEYVNVILEQTFSMIAKAPVRVG